MDYPVAVLHTAEDGDIASAFMIDGIFAQNYIEDFMTRCGYGCRDYFIMLDNDIHYDKDNHPYYKIPHTRFNNRVFLALTKVQIITLGGTDYFII